MCATSVGKNIVQFWVDVASSASQEEELARSDLISAGRPVLWVLEQQPPDNAVDSAASGTAATTIAATNDAFDSLILRGTVEVSLVDTLNDTGEADDSRRLWLSADIRAVPYLPLLSRAPRYGGAGRDDLPASASSTNGEGTGRQALLSPCLAEALGLAVDTSASAPVMVRLSVRTPSRIGVAVAVELCGPYRLPTASPMPGRAPGAAVPSDADQTNGRPPASFVASVSSILPCALEGEVVSRGSVLHLAGLFKVVVTGVWTNGTDLEVGAEEGVRGGEGIRRSTSGTVRVHSTTELRLVPPVTNGSTCAPASSPTPSRAYSPRDVRAWVRHVRRDFGGGGKEVAVAVRAAAAALRSSRRCNGGGGGDDWMSAPASGLLLHGPTGAGKTLLARSVAEHSGAPWFFLDCSSVFRKDRGKAERHVQDILEEARSCSPSIVVLDQVDTICRRRPEAAGITELQVFSVLLEAMDRFRRGPSGRSRVFLMATCPDATALDSSLLQRGRLESVLRIGSLDPSSRASILDIHARGMPLQLSFTLPPNTTAVSVVSALEDSNVDNTKNAGSLIHRAQGEDAPHHSIKGDAEEIDGRHSPAASSTVDASIISVGATVAPPPSLPRTRDEFLRLVAARCHGFLGSDLERLCREAAMRHMAATAATVAPEGFSKLAIKVDEKRCYAQPSCERQTLDVGNGLRSEEDARGRNCGGGEDGVRLQDFWQALDTVRPASLVGRSVGMWGGDAGPQGATSPAPLVGCDAAMAELRAFLLAPLADPSLLRRLGLRAATGALLHGPPGCGKTSVARALAAETRGVANFLEVRCSDLVDKVVGRSERSVSALFAAVRAAAPCVLFLDQVEGVAARRGYHSSTEQTFDRILSTLLVEMDGIMSESGGHVVVLAATNDISRLDPALLRPGRLDRRVYLGPPNLSARTAIFRQRLIAMPLVLLHEGSDDSAVVDRDKTLRAVDDTQKCGDNIGSSSVGLGETCLKYKELNSTEAYAEWLAEETEGYSGAQVINVCREAALVALREEISARKVNARHFDVALRSQRSQQDASSGRAGGRTGSEPGRY